MLDVADAHCELQIWVANAQVLSEPLKLKSLANSQSLQVVKRSQHNGSQVFRRPD
jgi:hypothetical protein